MGISELWRIISPGGKKFTLEQLSYDRSLKSNGKGLRVAIDVALWVFQARSSTVGDQSELRALFFRLCRLYELGIRPVFVFDGPQRPEYKRNRLINTTPIDTEFRRNLITLIRFFNFAIWHSYGEAEAECALLQRLGFVDVVFTGDSDVFLFGARRVVRNWPIKRNDPVLCYDLTWITDSTGLDRSDLILIALLHGSDYDTKGAKGIGINVAAQLAKCHFHRELMDDIQLTKRNGPLDDERVRHLFDDLTYELHHNSTKNLSRKHTSVALDPKFLEFSIMMDFIHPQTNIENTKNDQGMLTKINQLQNQLDYHHEPNWPLLAPFAQEAFKWPAEYLLRRFSSLLFHGYMANRLRRIIRRHDHNYRPTLSIQQSSSNSSEYSNRQTTLQEYYVSTTRHHYASTTVRDVVKITGTKIVSDDLKFFRVEWDPSCYQKFIDQLKPNLNYDEALYENIKLSQQGTMDLEEQLTDSQQQENKKEKKDVWTLIKRQWVHATSLYCRYPDVVQHYQRQQKKKSSIRVQKNCDSKAQSSVRVQRISENSKTQTLTNISQYMTKLYIPPRAKLF
ncbi:PIN domain-like protein [Cokeromyces recurvatus]|uniref:PIN domain-like protein n=1 Tax=Cokeromyces recurvatus TaxID=90255 RepID=UPI00221F2ADD|nr:PIN domain-like protein [Cokeromyces recurvatus]KAI7907556.1 PIN domain-like protein [Cokeromyces recurvatus]